MGLKPKIAEKKYIREERIKKLDNQNKNVLAIEDEKVDIPVISKEDMEKYKKQTEEARKAEETPTEPTAKGVEGYDDFVEYISRKKTYNWMLANILIKNGITDPKTGNGFYVAEIKDPNKKRDTKKQKAMMHGSTKTLDKTYLTELLRQKYNDGLIKNYLN